ncbi:site-specific recombinase DNA invertase Pin [Catellatospora methionotrophica]|uniref:Site-specific recombinase DNA invertase Pin n=1 Tax=Catellatospora methionotrophica TaxID=121620 RepID=A0A8J3LCV7_9ACTN|nr:recombinase family protein [Catellatospora methionotrophica]GIG18593.1 site-specific recombinase DNA invertase Pin [Catellatospora methionotrophica]
MTEIAQLLAGVYGRQSRNKAKSIDEQLDAGQAVASENGWKVSGTYQDGSSASRYARKGRDDWERVLADIASGALTVLILWEASRGDRTLTTWSQLLDLCRDKGVSIYVVSDERLYDPRKHKDWKSLAQSGVDSAGESDLISVRVRRGHAGAAAAGRPSHGRTPFGYVRRYDPGTGQLAGQEIDPDTAPIVREIFARIKKGEAVSTIVDDFNERGVKTSGAVKWYRVRVRDIAMNRAYLGQRVYNGSISEGIWPGIVDAETFYAVQRVLTDPKRVTTRPGRAVHLLSYLGTCSPCGASLTAVRGRYRCLDNGCVTIVQRDTDAFVENMVLEKLSRPDVYEQLRQHGVEDDEEVVKAREEIARLDDILAGWRLSAARHETTPASLAVIEADIAGQIRSAQRRADAAGVPPALRAILEPGADVRVRWEDAPMAARRRVVLFMATIVVDQAAAPGGRLFDFHRLGKSRWTGDPQSWGERWAGAGA